MASPPYAVGIGLLVACLTPFPAEAASAPPEPLCEISERLEIFNAAIEYYADHAGFEPVEACDVGRWRAMGEVNWVLSESDMHFVNDVALVPEPSGGGLGAALAALLALRALHRRC